MLEVTLGMVYFDKEKIRLGEASSCNEKMELLTVLVIKLILKVCFNVAYTIIFIIIIISI